MTGGVWKKGRTHTISGEEARKVGHWRYSQWIMVEEENMFPSYYTVFYGR